jgi:hypothetical protein
VAWAFAAAHPAPNRAGDHRPARDPEPKGNERGAIPVRHPDRLANLNRTADRYFTYFAADVGVTVNPDRLSDSGRAPGRAPGRELNRCLAAGLTADGD